MLLDSGFFERRLELTTAGAGVGFAESGQFITTFTDLLFALSATFEYHLQLVSLTGNSSCQTL